MYKHTIQQAQHHIKPPNSSPGNWSEHARGFFFLFVLHEIRGEGGGGGEERNKRNDRTREKGLRDTETEREAERAERTIKRLRDEHQTPCLSFSRIIQRDMEVSGPGGGPTLPYGMRVVNGMKEAWVTLPRPRPR